MASSVNSDTVTQGIRIRVFPEYMPQHSSPEDHRYFYAYRAIISNEGSSRARLLSRHWLIINANGHREDVRGPGVIGATPDLAPGESFEYTSFCPLDTDWGTMEGTYQMQRENGERFDAVIGRFYLSALPQP